MDVAPGQSPTLQNYLVRFAPLAETCVDLATSSMTIQWSPIDEAPHVPLPVTTRALPSRPISLNWNASSVTTSLAHCDFMPCGDDNDRNFPGLSPLWQQVVRSSWLRRMFAEGDRTLKRYSQPAYVDQILAELEAHVDRFTSVRERKTARMRGDDQMVYLSNPNESSSELRQQWGRRVSNLRRTISQEQRFNKEWPGRDAIPRELDHLGFGLVQPLFTVGTSPSYVRQSTVLGMLIEEVEFDPPPGASVDDVHFQAMQIAHAGSCEITGQDFGWP